MTAPSLFISPAVAFISGASTFEQFSQWVNDTPDLDPQMPGLFDLRVTLSSFTALVGPQYARKYSFETVHTVLETVQKESPEKAVPLLKGAFAALAGHLKQMSVGSQMAYGAALTLLQDEAVMDDEGGLHFSRFPRVLAAKVPESLPPGTLEVEDATNPGERLKTPIYANLTPEMYRETLDITSPNDAAAIFTDPLQIPARRILALKYWYFSLDGDVAMQGMIAKALLKTMTEEDWGDFQEFAVQITSNLLAKDFNLWMVFYFEKMWEFLSQQEFSQLKEDRIEPTKELVRQFGRGLYRHFEFLAGTALQRFDYNLAVLWLLGLAEESHPRPLREEGFHLATFILEDHYAEHNGPEMVHQRVKELAATEKDLDFLFGVIVQHILIGTPLPMQKVEEIIDVVCQRADLSEEQKDPFRLLSGDDRLVADKQKTGWWRRLLDFLTGLRR